MRKPRASGISDAIKAPSWPADKVERRAVASLVPYARNARTHSEEQVAQIAMLVWCVGKAKGDAMFDPYVGSGTTIIAAEMTGRACHAIEISPQYCDVTIQRWQNFTGQTATLERDGRAFADIETERRLVDAA